MTVLSCTAASDHPLLRVGMQWGAPCVEPSPSGTGRTPAEGSRSGEALNEKTDQDKPRRAHAGAEGTSVNKPCMSSERQGGDSSEEEP